MKSKINFSLVLMLALPLFYACDPYFGNKECQEEQTINQTMTIYPYRDTFALGDTIWIETKFELPANSPILNDSIYLSIPFNFGIAYLSTNPWQYAFLSYFSFGSSLGSYIYRPLSSSEHGQDAGSLRLIYNKNGNSFSNKLFIVCKKSGIYQIAHINPSTVKFFNNNLMCNQDLSILTKIDKDKNNFNYLLKHSVDTSYLKLDPASTYKDGAFYFFVK